MIIRKTAIIIGLVAIGLFQNSFLSRFAIFQPGWFMWINPVTAIVATAALFERRQNRFSWWLAVCGGAVMDIFSEHFFGFWLLVLLTLAAVIKFVIKKYVQIPSYW
jgi:hypothetical protein